MNDCIPYILLPTEAEKLQEKLDISTDRIERLEGKIRELQSMAFSPPPLQLEKAIKDLKEISITEILSQDACCIVRLVGFFAKVTGKCKVCKKSSRKIASK